MLAVGRARAATNAAVKVGLVGSEGPLAASILRGAEFGTSEADVFARLFGKRVELLVRTAASEEETQAAGQQLFSSERVAAVIGGATDGAAEALGKAAEQASGLFLNVGATSSRLREAPFSRRTFHVHPGLATLVNAAGLWLLEQRRTRWGLVVAQSRFGSEVRAAASALATRHSAQVLLRENVGPSLGDWGAVLGRVRDAQVDAVFAGLEPDVMRAFLASYRAAGLSCELAALSSDPHFALEAETAGLVGTWPLAWHQSLERYSARELNGRFSRRFERALDGAGWAAWAAVKLVAEAALRAESVEVERLLDFFERRVAFDGHKGAALSFRQADHELGQPLYIARPQPGAGGLEIVAEVSRERLDAVATPEQESR